ncbi:hypothetical protein CSA37_12535 [Candidatus Fermentibacteria bacterium]|nr:MAG: hypothetical protein CSA37_12535 [Candidatus Fermentibacteria bacterium]
MRGLLPGIVTVLTVGTLFAGNIDILGIRSAEYLMELSRNAVYDNPDGVTYNPAGLAFMDDGFHMSFGYQYVGKNYTIDGTWVGSTDETQVETNTPTLFIPNLYAVYKTGQFAAFGGFNAPAGGGSLEYDKGLFFMPRLESFLVQAQYGPNFFAMLNDGHMEGSSVYLGGVAGVSYAFSDKLGAGIAGRYTHGQRNYKGNASFTVIDAETMETAGTVTEELDVERSASGMSGVLSIHYRPVPTVNLAARYETATAMEFESTANTESNWEAILPYLADGALQRRDLPAVAAIGVDFAVNPNLRLGASGNYYFVENADQGEDDGINDAYEDGWEASISSRYQISEKVAGALGYSYSNYGGCDSTYTDLEYNLNAGLISGGVNWQATDAVDFTAALGQVFFEEGEGLGTYEGETYNKSVFFFAFGVNAFFGTL